MHKGVSQEVKWIFGWKIITLIDILNNSKGLIFLRIYLIGTSIGLTFLITPLITKVWGTATINGDGLILWEHRGLVQDSLVLYQYPIGKGFTTII